MSLIHNERWKLTATYLNGMAIAILAVGGLAPLVSYASASSSIGPVALAGLGVGCLVASAGLHLMARKVLERLKP